MHEVLQKRTADDNHGHRELHERLVLLFLGGELTGVRHGDGSNVLEVVGFQLSEMGVEGVFVGIGIGGGVPRRPQLRQDGPCKHRRLFCHVDAGERDLGGVHATNLANLGTVSVRAHGRFERQLPADDHVAVALLVKQHDVAHVGTPAVVAILAGPRPVLWRGHEVRLSESGRGRIKAVAVTPTVA